MSRQQIPEIHVRNRRSVGDDECFRVTGRRGVGHGTGSPSRHWVLVVRQRHSMWHMTQEPWLQCPGLAIGADCHVFDARLVKPRECV